MMEMGSSGDLGLDLRLQSQAMPANQLFDRIDFVSNSCNWARILLEWAVCSCSAARLLAVGDPCACANEFTITKRCPWLRKEHESKKDWIEVFASEEIKDRY